jgi:hypothetical protein
MGQRYALVPLCLLACYTIYITLQYWQGHTVFVNDKLGPGSPMNTTARGTFNPVSSMNTTSVKCNKRAVVFLAIHKTGSTTFKRLLNGFTISNGFVKHECMCVKNENKNMRLPNKTTNYWVS